MTTDKVIHKAETGGIGEFVVENFRFLSFGFLIVFFASFGQTFYVGLFGDEIRAAFGLSHGGFGAIYTIATLASALVIAWTGAWFDRLDLRVYASLVCAAFVAAHFVMALAGGLLALGLAIFLLRQAGQGLMVHTGQSAMARYFARNRGRAISLATLGIGAGEAVFPIVAVTLIAWLDWRGAWMATAVILAVGLIPLNLWLLKGHGHRHQAHLDRQNGNNEGDGDADWTRAMALRDPNFYLLILPFLGVTFLMTGLFFHQLVIGEAKGWDRTLIAQAFIVYSLVKVPATLGFGHLVDRVGAWRVTPYFLLPMAVSMLVLAFYGHWSGVFVYLAFAGLSAGGASTLLSALWAEIYGTAHLGSIRSFVMSLWVAAGAVSTWILGYFFDAGVTVRETALAAFVFIVFASILSGIGAARVGARLARG